MAAPCSPRPHSLCPLLGLVTLVAIGCATGELPVADEAPDGEHTHAVATVVQEAGQAVGAAYLGDGRPVVFAATAEGRVAMRHKLSHDPASDWTEWDDCGWAVSGVAPVRVAVVQHRDGRPQAFVVGTDGRVYTSSQLVGTHWSAWAQAATPFAVRDLAAAHAVDGSPRLYAASIDGRLAVQQHGATAWDRWQALTVPAESAPSAITAAMLADGREQLFVVCHDGQIRTTRQSTVGGDFTTTWQAFDRTGVDVEATFTADGRLLVVAVEADGTVWQRSKVSASPDAAWGAWSQLTGVPAGAVTLSAVRLEDGRPQLVMLARDALFTASWDVGGDAWSGWIGF